MTRRFGHGHRWDGGCERDRDGGDRWHHKADGDQRDGRMYGGRGDDDLRGSAGDDRMYGGRGDDQLFGGTGDDKMFGGRGDDVFVRQAGDGSDYVNGGRGHDVLRLDTDGWTLDLDRGAAVASDDGGIQLSCGAAGTIMFGDGSTLRFAGLERIETVAAGPEQEPGNQAPGGLALTAGQVAEDVPDGTVVGSVTAADPDAGDTLTYALTDDADGRFAIDPSTGVITVADAARLDYESAARHEITVSVTDAGGLHATGAFTIGVADVNEAPLVADLSSAKVIESAPDGTVVGGVIAADPDAGDTLTYALSDDADGRFAIDPATGVITVADTARLDYTSDTQHTITVRVTDAGGLGDEASYTIEVALDNSGDDTLTGDDGDNVIDGGPGDDRIAGLAGNDHLIGGDGDDELDGGDGDDVALGNAGDDLLVGGDGADRLDGGDGDDFMFGDDGNDQLFGGNGDDQLLGGRDDDVLDGGDGNDRLQAGGGDDVLSGGAGEDALFGGLGDDILAGGAGEDRLMGDSGADRFVFTGIEDGVDTIVDFEADDVLAIGDMLVGFAEGDEAAFVNVVDDGSAITIEIDPDGAVNGATFTPIAVLEALTGTTLADLVNADQIDFWLS